MLPQSCPACERKCLDSKPSCLASGQQIRSSLTLLPTSHSDYRVSSSLCDFALPTIPENMCPTFVDCYSCHCFSLALLYFRLLEKRNASSPFILFCSIYRDLTKLSSFFLSGLSLTYLTGQLGKNTLGVLSSDVSTNRGHHGPPCHTVQGSVWVE